MANLWYFTWRIITEFNQHITYSFLTAGQFAPYRCFGVVKKSYKIKFISSIYELAGMAEASSAIGVNKAQLVATHNNRIIVPVYDWALFPGQFFNKLPNIKKNHHFHFSSDEPGKIFFKESSSSCGQSFMLLKDLLCPALRRPS